VIQETRLWNENRDQTEPMRKKENAHDYRYFPEPDLPVFAPDKAFLDRVEQSLVELPLKRTRRLEAEYGLTHEQADLICEEKEEADYFEAAAAAVVSRGGGKKEAASRIANFLLIDIKRLLHREGLSPSAIASFRLTPLRMASLVVLLGRGEVSTKNARQALEAAVAEDQDPADIIREKGWERISDPAVIAGAVNAVYQAEAAVFAEAAASDPKRRRTLAAYLLGKVLAATSGRADPKIAGEQLNALLDGKD
jgi:aspartyl-tRNA(Asn)/glutamyl-tRNA(Gln) amidotransferase subunit B